MDSLGLLWMLLLLISLFMCQASNGCQLTVDVIVVVVPQASNCCPVDVDGPSIK